MCDWASKFTGRTNGPPRGHSLAPSVGGDNGWTGGAYRKLARLLFQVLSSYPQATAGGTTCVSTCRRERQAKAKRALGRATQVYVYRRRRWSVRAQFRLTDRADNSPTSWTGLRNLQGQPGAIIFKTLSFSLLQNGHSSKWNKWDKDSACEDFGKERPPLQPYICSS